MADQHSKRPLTSPTPEILFDDLCDQFELACQQGLHQSIEDTLLRWEADSAPLFRELLSLELEYRLDASQVPTRKEYVTRFSDQAALIKAVFSELGIDDASRNPHQIEATCSHGHHFFARARHAGRSVRCPHCKETVRLPDDKSNKILSQHAHTPTSKQSGIRVTCENGHSFRVKSRYAGKRGKCHHCDAIVTVPDLQNAPPTQLATEKVLRGSRTHKFDETIRQTGKQLGRFQLSGLLGEGAFGTVYRARDPQLERDVALKVPRFGTIESEQDAQRFLREARAAAQLHHPNIVAVHDANTDGFTYYIATALVEGQSLRELLNSGREFTHREAAELVAKLARALHYAHAQGVVHRDMKPANVLINVEGEPHIADFGLARHESGDGLRTQEGVRMGTPSYMSPEQASGQSHKADGRSDQWSLGVMLYELISGRRPFEGSAVEIMDAVRNDEPPPLGQVDPRVGKDLATICHKCLAKSPNDRYPTCGELADDLQHWQRGEPIAARPISYAERALRWAKREPVLAGLAGIVFGLCVALMIIAAVLFSSRRAILDTNEQLFVQRKVARDATDKAIEKEQQARQSAAIARKNELESAKRLKELEEERRRTIELGRDVKNLEEQRESLTVDIEHNQNELDAIYLLLAGEREKLAGSETQLIKKTDELDQKTSAFQQKMSDYGEQIKHLATDRWKAYCESLGKADLAAKGRDWGAVRMELEHSPSEMRSWEWAVLYARSRSQGKTVNSGQTRAMPRYASQLKAFHGWPMATSSTGRYVGVVQSITKKIGEEPVHYQGTYDSEKKPGMIGTVKVPITLIQHFFVVMDTETGKRVPCEFALEELSGFRVLTTGLSDDGYYLAVIYEKKENARLWRSVIWDLRRNRAVQHHSDVCVHRVSFTQDGKRYIITYADGRVILNHLSGNTKRLSDRLLARADIKQILRAQEVLLAASAVNHGSYTALIAYAQEDVQSTKSKAVVVVFGGQGLPSEQSNVKTILLPDEFEILALNQSKRNRLLLHPMLECLAVSNLQRTVFVDCVKGGIAGSIAAGNFLGFSSDGKRCITYDSERKGLAVWTYPDGRSLPHLGSIDRAYDSLLSVVAATLSGNAVNFDYDPSTATIYWRRRTAIPPNSRAISSKSRATSPAVHDGVILGQHMLPTPTHAYQVGRSSFKVPRFQSATSGSRRKAINRGESPQRINRDE